MRFLRILPETAASTTCSVLSSWTLKKALGCLSMMVPSAGIKSSLANQYSPNLIRFDVRLKPKLSV